MSTIRKPYEPIGHVIQESRAAAKIAGFISKPSLEDYVRFSLIVLLATRRGERMLSPDYGNDLHQFTFAPNTEGLRERIAEHIEEVIIKNEPNVENITVAVEPYKREPTKLAIHITYEAKQQGLTSRLDLNLDLQGDHFGALPR